MDHDRGFAAHNRSFATKKKPSGTQGRVPLKNKRIVKFVRRLNQSLSSGQIPTEWKSAGITPIHKKDSKEPAENYRPISLLPIVSKVLERCVVNCLYDHVNNLITPLQHGFLRNHSFVTQLLSVLHTIGRNLDKNVQTDVIYLDFAKAFDTVDHYVLLSKLKAYGVLVQLLTWFANYLSGRLQRVVIDGATSQWAPVTSGVR